MNFSVDKEKNFFEFFDIEQSFKVDTPFLQKFFEKEQNDISKAMIDPAYINHMQEMMDRAVYLNEAYNTLINPHKRALYIIKMHGVDLSKKDPIITSSFRMTAMNITSALEEAQSNNDPYSSFRDLLARVSTEIDKLCRTLDLALEYIDDILDWSSVASSLQELDFFLGIQSKLQNLLYNFLRHSQVKS